MMSERLEKGAPRGSFVNQDCHHCFVARVSKWTKSMYRYAKTGNEVKWLASMDVPYSIECALIRSIQSDTEVFLDDGISKDFRYVEYFEFELSKELLDRNYNVLFAKPNDMGKSIYTVCVLRDSSNIVKLYCEMMFTFRPASYPQKSSLSDEAKAARSNTQESGLDHLKALCPGANPVIPDMGYFVTIKKSENGEEPDFFGIDIKKAIEFIADDIDSYVEDEIKTAIDSGEISEDS